LQKLGELRADRLGVRRARHDEDGNVEQAAIDPMVADRIEAEALDIALRIDSEDGLFFLRRRLGASDGNRELPAIPAPIFQLKRRATAAISGKARSAVSGVIGAME
jgi:hypothetical protein